MTKKHIVILTEDERADLHRRVSTGSTHAGTQTHARIMLKADQEPGAPAWSDQTIAVALDVSLPTVERVRKRFAEEGLGMWDAAGAVLFQVRHRASRRCQFCLVCGRPVPSTGAMQTSTTTPHANTSRHLADKILAGRDALDGERKQVTCLLRWAARRTEAVRGRWRRASAPTPAPRHLR